MEILTDKQDALDFRNSNTGTVQFIKTCYARCFCRGRTDRLWVATLFGCCSYMSTQTIICCIDKICYADGWRNIQYSLHLSIRIWTLLFDWILKVTVVKLSVWLLINYSKYMCHVYDMLISWPFNPASSPHVILYQYSITAKCEGVMIICSSLMGEVMAPFRPGDLDLWPLVVKMISRVTLYRMLPMHNLCIKSELAVSFEPGCHRLADKCWVTFYSITVKVTDVTLIKAKYVNLLRLNIVQPTLNQLRNIFCLS